MGRGRSVARDESDANPQMRIFRPPSRERLYRAAHFQRRASTGRPPASVTRRALRGVEQQPVLFLQTNSLPIRVTNEIDNAVGWYELLTLGVAATAAIATAAAV